MMQSAEWDFIIIGSGFGGSVSAMRLAQKGYKVLVLEAGKRYTPETLPKSNWDVRRYLWAPLLRCFGIQRISLLKGVMVLHGAGVGGGSLVYANTLLKPADPVFKDPSWPSGTDWDAELSPHYEEARRMLGVAVNPQIEDAERALSGLGKRLGVEKSFHPTEVAVYFGEAGKEVADPYFSGSGPARAGCIGCGGCMIGCRYQAKNTLDQNYLYFAEKWGAQVHPETTVERIVPVEGGYRVETKKSTAWFGSSGPSYAGAKVIVAAGVLGTTKILFRNKQIHRTLPNISDRLGHTVRTNGESLCGATSYSAEKDYSKGIAIGAAIRTDERTTIEAVKYPSGSDFMRILAVPLTPEGTRITRPLKLLLRIITRFGGLLKTWLVKDWAKQTIILLVMQSIEQKMHLYLKHGKLAGRAEADRVPSYLPIAQKASVELAGEIHGEPQNVISEVLLATPATAHILGGCAMDVSPEKGVVSPEHEVFGHPGLYVCDGSVVPCNLGVNPSLTISALAERFAAQFPVKDQAAFSGRRIKYSAAPSGVIPARI